MPVRAVIFPATNKDPELHTFPPLSHCLGVGSFSRLP